MPLTIITKKHLELNQTWLISCAQSLKFDYYNTPLIYFLYKVIVWWNICNTMDVEWSFVKEMKQNKHSDVMWDDKNGMLIRSKRRIAKDGEWRWHKEDWQYLSANQSSQFHQSWFEEFSAFTPTDAATKTADSLPGRVGRHFASPPRTPLTFFTFHRFSCFPSLSIMIYSSISISDIINVTVSQSQLFSLQLW